MNPRHILYTVADYYGDTIADLTGRAQHQPLPEHRQIAIYLCRELTSASYPTIAKELQRDHSTIVSGDQAIRRRLIHAKRHGLGTRLADDIATITKLAEDSHKYRSSRIPPGDNLSDDLSGAEWSMPL